MEQDIFDYLAAELHCMIADLKISPEHRLTPERAACVPDDRFPLESWDALLSYLYEAPLHFSSVAEARAYLAHDWHRPAAEPPDSE